MSCSAAAAAVNTYSVSPTGCARPSSMGSGCSPASRSTVETRPLDKLGVTGFEPSTAHLPPPKNPAEGRIFPRLVSAPWRARGPLMAQAKSSLGLLAVEFPLPDVVDPLAVVCTE